MPVPSQRWGNIAPPEDWGWYQQPHQQRASRNGNIVTRGTLSISLRRPNIEQISGAFEKLWAWLEVNTEAWAITQNVGYFSDTSDTQYPNNLRVFFSENAQEVAEGRELWPEVTCRHGNCTGRWGILCNCDDTPVFLGACSTSGYCRHLPPYGIAWHEGDQAYRCEYCAQRGTYSPCANCNLDVLYEERFVFDDQTYCSACANLYCAECEAVQPAGTRMVAINAPGSTPGVNVHRRVCPACNEAIEARTSEEHDASPLTDNLFLFESPDRRPIRTCGVEIEVANRGAEVAAALYSVGLARNSGIIDYHAAPRPLPDGTFPIASVQHDSSLPGAGGEVVLDRINLDEENDARDTGRIVALLMQQVDQGLRVNHRCGLHVHIDAHRFGIGDVRNLVLLTNYIEDPIYRLAAANYADHRGTAYSQPVDKGPFENRRAFGNRFFRNNGHRSALNVSHYWQAIQNCQCGAALVGEHDTCECNLGKCTFEFRYFNGTVNERKLHAYIALTQSLCALAKQLPDLSETDLPPMEFQPEIKAVADVPADGRRQWEERLRWMLRNLYFSDSERESLKYVADRSLIGATLGDLSSIFTEEYNPQYDITEYLEVPKSYRNVPDGGTSPQQALLDAMNAGIQWQPASIDDDYYDEDEEF